MTVGLTVTNITSVRRISYVCHLQYPANTWTDLEEFLYRGMQASVLPLRLYLLNIHAVIFTFASFILLVLHIYLCLSPSYGFLGSCSFLSVSRNSADIFTRSPINYLSK